MTRQSHRSLHPTPLATVLALAVGAVGLAACSQDEETGKAGSADRAPTAERERVTPPGAERGRAAGPDVRMELAAGVGLDRSSQAELAAATRRFSTTLAGWLYGDRHEIDVDPVTARVRRELATAPPYIPRDQIGSADGQAVHVEVSVQTRRSGVLAVTIRDSRTGYPIPASLELRAAAGKSSTSTPTEPPMPRNVTPLALIALIAIIAAVMAALAGSDIMDPTGNTPPAPGETEERRSDPANPAPADPIVDAARRYALAARNWTPATYRSSWDRQIELAAGRYRRALIAKRPGRREFVALRKDRARSKARVLRTERDRRIRPPSARVVVTLEETTSAGGQTIRGATVNEVRLRRHGDQWLVIGWTVIPGG